jgi:hypothetical protein
MAAKPRRKRSPAQSVAASGAMKPRWARVAGRREQAAWPRPVHGCVFAALGSLHRHVARRPRALPTAWMTGSGRPSAARRASHSTQPCWSCARPSDRMYQQSAPCKALPTTGWSATGSRRACECSSATSSPAAPPQPSPTARERSPRPCLPAGSRGGAASGQRRRAMPPPSAARPPASLLTWAAGPRCPQRRGQCRDW